MLKHAVVIALALCSIAQAGPDDEKSESLSMFQPALLTEALESDYRGFIRTGQPFPKSPAANHLFRLEPASAPAALVAATEAWVLKLYPSIEERPIDELQDGLTDPKGAGARRKVLQWLLKAKLSDLRRQELAVTVFSRESDRECRNAIFASLHPDLVKGQDLGIIEGLFKVVETDSASMPEAEKFLAVRALVSLAVRLPEPKIAEVHRRLQQMACDQSNNVSEEIVRSLGASLPRALRIDFIHEVLTSGRYPELAKIGAVALIQHDRTNAGELHPKLEAAMRIAADKNPDEVIAQEIREILAVPAPAASDDCPVKYAKLSRRPPSQG